MSSASKRREDGHSLFASEVPHFFKIILEDTIQAGKLGMPRKFTKSYGSSLPSLVSLRVPSGAVWQVELSKQNDNIFLNYGWREFVDYFSIDYGHLLVFEYKGCGQFHVLIFDKSATEIHYPKYSTVCDEEPQFDGKCKESAIERTVHDDSVEILRDFATSQRARQRSLSRSPRPLKKMRNDSTSQTNGTLMSTVPRSRQNGTQSSGSNPGTSRLYGKACGDSPGIKGGESMCSDWRRSKARVFERPQPLTLSGKSKALQTASAFRSENPYVTIFMQPHYIRNFHLGVPVDFAREHLTEKHGDATLSVPDGRTWSVKYHWYSQLKKPKASIMKGWKAFVLDNNLEAGDACVFELIETLFIKLKVTIFRFADDPNLHRSLGNAPPLAGKLKVEALQKVGFKSDSPFFTIIMKKSYIYPAGKVCIPFGFVEKHLNKKRCRIILRGQDGGTWPVTLFVNHGHAYLLGGWKVFTRENNLQVGDICAFELHCGTEFSFNVFICNGYEGQPASQDPTKLLTSP